MSSFSSREAPTKLVPWLLQTTLGFPRRAMNLRRQARNALVVNSETSSIWTALTDIDTNTHIYAFEMVGLHMGPYLIFKGPA